MNSKILKKRKYKAGYVVKTELVDGKEYGGTDFEMKCAYNVNGDYIGDPKTAYRLCVKRGIKPEKAKESHSVCSIGFCEKDKKWYGWSHRAIYGFEVGSKVLKGDCAFIPANRLEYVESLKEWYSDDMYKNLQIIEKEDCILVSYDINQEKTGKVFHTESKEPLDISYGKGEWTAKTLEEAKEMAIDFARSVS